MKRIAVLTSGGDAPGMNAAIRSVTRFALNAGCEVFGVRRGYAGLIDADFWSMQSRDVGEIMQRGGTILGSSRSQEFRTVEGQKKAVANLAEAGIEGLVVIGGNGSQTGAYALSQLGLPVVGIASTIDNDVYGFDVTLGVDTALNIALESIDRLKTTATSHQRAFLVQVMGRDCGYLALMAGLAGGAEAIVIPEKEIEPEEVAREVFSAHDRGKPQAIVVVAEGAKNNGPVLERYFHEHHSDNSFEVRLTILGHVQRGGEPGFADRILGLRSGVAAARALLEGRHGIVCGEQNGKIGAMPLDEVKGRKKPLDISLLDVAEILSM